MGFEHAISGLTCRRYRAWSEATQPYKVVAFTCSSTLHALFESTASAMDSASGSVLSSEAMSAYTHGGFPPWYTQSKRNFDKTTAWLYKNLSQTWSRVFGVILAVNSFRHYCNVPRDLRVNERL